MDVDLPALEPGASKFSIQPVSSREEISNALSAKATEAIKKSKAPTSQFKVPLARSKTPLGRLARAASAKGDSQLRKSYASPRVSSGASFTPTPVSAGRMMTPSSSRVSKKEGGATPIQKMGDITDGLLDI